MKKEIGKWFMDVAKYIATAVLLTQIFGGMADSAYIIAYALISVVIIFSLGVSIIHSDDEDKKRIEKRKTKILGNERYYSNFNIVERNGHCLLDILPR